MDPNMADSRKEGIEIGHFLLTVKIFRPITLPGYLIFYFSIFGAVESKLISNSV